MRGILHSIEEDLEPMESEIPNTTCWELAVRIAERIRMCDLLANHAEAERVFRALYPEP